MASDDKEGSKAFSAAAAEQAQRTFESAKEFVAGTDFDELRSKASDAASSLLKEGREFLASNDELTKATDQLAASIRKNPLAAVGIAFTAGLVLALLTRG